MFILLIIGFTLFFFYTDKIKKEGNDRYYKREYQGIIDNILYLKGNRGAPSIEIKGDLIHLSVQEDKVRHHILVGDSIVKVKNSYTITVFRKDSMNNWNEKVYE